MTRVDFRRRSSRLERDDGTVAIEFAVVGLLFFALLLGSIEMGRAMWMRNSLQFAAEEAVRWKLVRPTASTTEIQDFARTKLSGKPATATITATFETASGVTYLVVTTSQVFTPVTTLVSTGIITVTGRARMPVG